MATTTTPKRTPAAQHAALGTTWKTHRGIVHAFVRMERRDDVTVAKWLTRNGFRAEVTAIDECAPEVPEGLVTVQVTPLRFDALVTVLRAAITGGYRDDVMLFRDADDAFRVENAEVRYDDLPYAGWRRGA